MLLALGAACGSNVDANEHQGADARWQAAGIEDYRCTWYWQVMVGTSRFSVEVRDGEVISTSLTGEPPAYMGEEPFTVDGAFDRLRRITRDADKVEVSYDPELGYPRSVSVDRISNAIDDEYRFGIRELRPLG